MDTHPIPRIDDARVLPTNPRQEEQKNSLEEPSISTTFDEQAPHCTSHELKHRFSWGVFQLPHQVSLKLMNHHLNIKLLLI